MLLNINFILQFLPVFSNHPFRNCHIFPQISQFIRFFFSKLSVFLNLYISSILSNFNLVLDKPQIHRRRYRTKYQERNRKRRRRKNRVFRNRNGGCAGTCRNMFSCMFSGLKVEWDAPEGSCPGLMDTCCTSWNSPPTRHKKYIKSGRSLGPFSPQVQVRKPN